MCAALIIGIALVGIGVFSLVQVCSDVRAINIALEDTEVNQMLTMYREQGYEIETFVKRKRASHVVTFRIMKRNDDGQIIDSVLYWIYVSAVTNSVVDIQARSTNGAIYSSKQARVTQAFLYEFPEAKSSAEIQGTSFTVAWGFENNSIVLIFRDRPYVQDAKITNWPSMRSPQMKITYMEAVNISKNTEQVQRFIEFESNATSMVGKIYLENSSAYYVTEDWVVLTLAGGPLGKGGLLVGKYCWTVHWYNPASYIPHIVNVDIDVETGEIVSVQEAW